MHGFEIEFDETNDKLNKALESLEEKEKHLKEVEADIAALTRRSVVDTQIWNEREREKQRNREIDIYS